MDYATVVQGLEIYFRFLIPSLVILWNNLTPEIKNSPIQASFKYKLKRFYNPLSVWKLFWFFCYFLFYLHSTLYSYIYTFFYVYLCTYMYMYMYFSTCTNIKAATIYSPVWSEYIYNKACVTLKTFCFIHVCQYLFVSLFAWFFATFDFLSRKLLNILKLIKDVFIKLNIKYTSFEW